MAYYNNSPFSVYPNMNGYNMPQQQIVQQPYQQTQAMMQQPMQQTAPSLTVRYVAGREEAVASQVLPDGNMCVFVDVAHGMIYTKQINPQTGLCTFTDYQRVIPVEPMAQQQTAQQYAPMDQFTALRKDVDDIMATLTASHQQNASSKTQTTERR